jgi:hypothetical protein
MRHNDSRCNVYLYAFLGEIGRKRALIAGVYLIIQQ